MNLPVDISNKMKKTKKMTLLCIAVVAAISMVATKTDKSNAFNSSELLMRNVEALSQGDTGTKKLTCYNTITSKDGCMVRYCATCSFVPGTDSWYSIASEC